MALISVYTPCVVCLVCSLYSTADNAISIEMKVLHGYVRDAVCEYYKRGGLSFDVCDALSMIVDVHRAVR